MQQLAQVAQARRPRQVLLRKALPRERDAVRVLIMHPQPVDYLCGNIWPSSVLLWVRITTGTGLTHRMCGITTQIVQVWP